MSVEALQRSELVDPGTVGSDTEDQFDHVSLVDELVDLVTRVNTPANIALFGPWGSGKSTIAHLLESRFPAGGGVRFFRFDAFKYGEAPLRRKFIAQTAADLGIANPRYSAGLSTDRRPTASSACRESGSPRSWAPSCSSSP